MLRSAAPLRASWVASLALVYLPAGPLPAEPDTAVVVLVDTSGSMNEPKTPHGTPLEQAVAAASLFVAGCDSSIAPGLIAFDSDVRLLTDRLAPATPAHRRTVLASLRQLRAEGRTDLLGAVSAALKLLEDSNASAKWIVLLSDGCQTEDVPAQLRDLVPDATPAALRAHVAGKALARRARNRNVRVLAVGLGKDVDRALLEGLAVETGGAFLAIEDAGRLLPAYADWLQAVGGYCVARNVEQVQVADSDSDFKVLMALPGAHLLALERDGRPIDTNSGVFESWRDEGRHLSVLQAPRPEAGTYRARFASPCGPADHVFFLKRGPRRLDVRMHYQAADPFAPVRVEVRGLPTSGAKPWEAHLAVTDTQGEKKADHLLRLQAGPDGVLTGQVHLDDATPDGARNVRVRLRDPGSGWEAEHVQTVRFEAGPFAVRASIALPAKAGTLTTEPGAEIDLGELPPGAEQAVELQLRSTPAALGHALALEILAGSGELLLEGPREVVLQGGSQTVPLRLRVPTPFAKGPARASLRLALPGNGATINGSRQPVEFRFVARPTPALVRLQLLDAAGNPLPCNVCKHRVLSPVTARTEVLRFVLLGEADTASWGFRLIRAESDGVRCELEQPRRQPGGPNQLVVRLNLPAQTPPGTRSFPFDVEPGPNVQLTPDSRQFRVELEVPQATITLGPPTGGALEIRRQLGYLDWLRLRVLGRPFSWKGEVALSGESAGLDKDVGWQAANVGLGSSPGSAELHEGSSEGEATRAWTATLGAEIPATGNYPLTVRVDCPYRHVQLLDPAGSPLPDAPGVPAVVVGHVHFLAPSATPPLLIALALAGTFVLDRLRRRRVPGLLVVYDAGTGLGADPTTIRLGRKRHRVALGSVTLAIRRRWQGVEVRWVGGGPDEVVVVVCPGGHRRPLRRNGAWEALCHQDSIHTDRHTAEYLAPVARHCPAPTAGQPGPDGRDACWDDPFVPQHDLLA